MRKSTVRQNLAFRDRTTVWNSLPPTCSISEHVQTEVENGYFRTMTITVRHRKWRFCVLAPFTSVLLTLINYAIRSASRAQGTVLTRHFSHIRQMTHLTCSHHYHHRRHSRCPCDSSPCGWICLWPELKCPLLGVRTDLMNPASARPTARTLACVLGRTAEAQTLVSDDYAPQSAGHASLPGPTAPLVTELLHLPVPGYGTVYRHISEMLTYRTVGSGGH